MNRGSGVAKKKDMAKEKDTQKEEQVKKKEKHKPTFHSRILSNLGSI